MKILTPGKIHCIFLSNGSIMLALPVGEGVQEYNRPKCLGGRVGRFIRFGDYDRDQLLEMFRPMSCVEAGISQRDDDFRAVLRSEDRFKVPPSDIVRTRG